MAQSRVGRTFDGLRREQMGTDAREMGYLFRENEKLSRAIVPTTDVQPLRRSLAHEIKSPVTVIEAVAQPLFDSPHPLQRRHRDRLIRIVQHSIKRLERLGDGLPEPAKGRGHAHGE